MQFQDDKPQKEQKSIADKKLGKRKLRPLSSGIDGGMSLIRPSTA